MKTQQSAQAQTAEKRESHPATLMIRIPRTEHYSNKNWSVAFSCPWCANQIRKNTNFLGRRKMFCLGDKTEARK